MPKEILISGDAKLVSVYEDSRNGMEYFSRIKIRLRAPDKSSYNEIEAEVPISEKVYKQLFEELKKSDVNKTKINVVGKLELKVE